MWNGIPQAPEFTDEDEDEMDEGDVDRSSSWGGGVGDGSGSAGSLSLSPAAGGTSQNIGRNTNTSIHRCAGLRICL